MHELPEPLVNLLRAQGVSDAELEELRTTGSIERGGPTGSINIVLGAPDQATATVSTVSIGGTVVGANEIPPEALDKLRRFHKFMPKGTVHQIEAATGHDIDGDGLVGAPGAATPAAATPAMPAVGSHAVQSGMPTALENAGARAAHHNVSGAMPGVGPFVEKSTGAKLIPIILVLVVLGALAFFLLR